MNLNLINLISLFSGFLLLLLGVIFVFYPHGKKVSNIILATFMFSNSLLLLNFFAFLSFSSYITTFPIINHFAGQTYLLLAPILFLYIVSLCKDEFKIRFKHLFHALPYIIFAIYACLLYYSNEYNVKLNREWILFNLWYHILLHLQIILYIIISFRVLINYRNRLKDRYSSLIKINLVWVNILLYLFILMWVTDLLNFLLFELNYNTPRISNYLIYQSLITNLILCISLIFKGMQQNIIPSTIISDLKYSQTKLEIDDYEKYKLQLLDFMTKQKPHLEPNLTIDELSAKTNIPQKYLSQTINTCFNLNFNSFINSYRVTEAKCLMESDINNSKTIYHILLDSGFNSKSVFNEAFKKFAGTTPKEYRLKIKS